MSHRLISGYSFDDVSLYEELSNEAHMMSVTCLPCNRPFVDDEALQQHLRDSPAHTETPLDTFFRSFPTFIYDPSQPPATSYASLQAYMNWRRGEAASADAWDRYQSALEDEIRLWYGEEDDLAAWHALCHAIGVEPPPRTCGQCERVWCHYTPAMGLMLTFHTGCSKNTCQHCRSY
jgi:hypothetical protein